jgi:hypothetical protein
MPEIIQFPNPGDDGYTDGITCQTYEWGWVSSGCTDDDGEYRGFTQEWYYDGDIGAWVAVTVDGAAGGLSIEGATYDGVTHAAPAWEPGVTGFIRKVTFLDPATGSLTFDYIHMYDVLGPNESNMLFAGAFPGYTLYDSRVQLGTRLGIAGVTLCAPKNYEFIWHLNSSPSAVITQTFNIDPDTGEVSPFNPGAPATATISYQSSMNGTGLAPTTTPSGLTLPYSFVPLNGPETNTLTSGDLYIAFTADGPSRDALKLKSTFTRTDTGGVGQINFSNVVSTENYYYIFVTGEADINVWDSNLIKQQASGATALMGILNPASGNPSTNPQNHTINKTFSTTDFNMSASSNSGYVYVAMPARVNIQPSELYQNVQFGGGFQFGEDYYKEVSITNYNGYTETYDLFRSFEPSGLDVTNSASVFKIQTS